MYVPEQHIDIINLRKKSKRSINFHYIFDDVAQMNIETFHDTNMFCIIEKGTFNQPKLRLSYFKYDECHNFSEEKVLPCSVYQSIDNIWTYEFPVKRLNCSSKIGWFRYKHGSWIEFYVYSLDKNPTGEL